MDEQDPLNTHLVAHVRARADALLREAAEADVELTTEEAVTLADGEFVDDVLDEERLETVADRLAALGNELLETRRESEAGFTQRLNSSYGKAFDAFDTVVEVVAEAARAFWHRYRTNDPDDDLINTLWGNLAQCLRVTREVGHLLRGGFPYGALAAQRTAYEIAVRTTLLSDHARKPGHEDLVERYLLHDHIGHERDLREYQKNAETLGFDPIDEADLEAATARRKELVERFGKTFASPYGWAVGLPGVTAGQFDKLEKLAGVSHRRGFYAWSSHFVHGDPSALRMSVMRRGGVSLGVVSDRTNRYLTDPAQFALYALQLTYINLIYRADNVDNIAHADFLISRGLPQLVARAGDAFWEAEEQIEAAEERVQQEIADEEREGQTST